MFDNQKYITKGVSQQISIYLQIIMWNLINELEIEKDYLQVFELTSENGMQKITHSQEMPPYEKSHLIKCEEPVTAKIFVIDDETHSTMLLAEEY